MFGECAIDVTNSKVKIELDKDEKRRWKKIEVRKHKKIRDHDNRWYYVKLWNQRFSKLSYTNREIDKSNKLLLIFCSLSLEGTKEGEVIQLDYQHVYVWDLEKLFVLHVLLFCIFSGGPIGVIFANIICNILKPLWLWNVQSNAFVMKFNIWIWIKIVKMQLLLLARKAQAHG